MNGLTGCGLQPQDADCESEAQDRGTELNKHGGGCPWGGTVNDSEREATCNEPPRSARGNAATRAASMGEKRPSACQLGKSR